MSSRKRTAANTNLSKRSSPRSKKKQSRNGLGSHDNEPPPVSVSLFGDSNSVGFTDCKSHLWREIQRVLGHSAIVTRVAKGGSTIGPSVKTGRFHFLQWMTGRKTGLRKKWQCDFGGSRHEWESARDQELWPTPHVSIIMLGTNDIDQWTEESFGDAFGADYQASLAKSFVELVDHIQGRVGAGGSSCKISGGGGGNTVAAARGRFSGPPGKVVICLPPDGRVSNERTKAAVHKVLREYANTHGAFVVDPCFSKEDGDFYHDQAHITKPAATRLAEALGRVFDERKLLE